MFEFEEITAEEAEAAIVKRTRTSTLKELVRAMLADFPAADTMPILAVRTDRDDDGKIVKYHGLQWHNFSDEIREAVKERKNNRGMKSLEYVLKSLQDDTGWHPVLQDEGSDLDSGNIYFTSLPWIESRKSK